MYILNRKQVIEYQGVRLQLLDLPGIVEGASQGSRFILCPVFTHLAVQEEEEVDRSFLVRVRS